MKLVGRVALFGTLLLALLGNYHAQANVIQVALTKMARSSEVDWLHSRYRNALNAAAPSEKVNLADDNSTTTQSASANSATPQVINVDAAETRIFSGEGSHTIQVTVGGQPRTLIIDTGSGKTAFVCEGCNNCGTRHENAPFQFTSNTKYLTCASSNSCAECTTEGKCKYSQVYVEGDYWLANKVSDVMAFAPKNQPAFQAPVNFGCIYAQDGVFNTQTSDGIMGFSKHADSIFEQFYQHKVTKSRIFSQCLSQNGGILTLGGVDMSINYDPVVYTPIRNTGFQYWTVTLLSISIGSTELEIDNKVYNKHRGTVFDSGTTFVYMPLAIEAPLKAAWAKAVGDDQFPISDYYYDLTEAQLAHLPDICFHLLNDAKVCVPPSLYFYRVGVGKYAGTLFFGDGAKSLIIGASALTNHNVIYDVDNLRIGVAKANCEATVSSTATDNSTTTSAVMVELSINPGGDKFRSISPAIGSYDALVQWILASATFLGVIGLVNALWMELKDIKAEKAHQAQLAKQGDVNVNEADGGRVPSASSCALLDEEEEDRTSAFSFILMRDDDERQVV
uniref:Peptidase A1 domain-containing protein n=1 Tax=Globisporangium ultimum (strain ATCC 200006 / CBS 805.95 / DAOM BR144) TaxID=431595 RepID=K3WZX7_GLOUD